MTTGNQKFKGMESISNKFRVSESTARLLECFRKLEELSSSVFVYLDSIHGEGNDAAVDSSYDHSYRQSIEALEKKIQEELICNIRGAFEGADHDGTVI